MTDDRNITRRQSAPGDVSLNGRPPNGRDQLRLLWVCMEWGLQISRRAVVVPVIVLAVSAVVAFADGTALLIGAIGHMARHTFPAGNNARLFFLAQGAFLVSVMLIIAAAGFYQLLVSDTSVGRPRGYLPCWLLIRDWADLSARIIPILALVSVACFAATAASFHNGLDVVFLGAAIAMVVAALAVFVRFGSDRPTL